MNGGLPGAWSHRAHCPSSNCGEGISALGSLAPPGRRMEWVRGPILNFQMEIIFPHCTQCTIRNQWGQKTIKAQADPPKALGPVLAHPSAPPRADTCAGGTGALTVPFSMTVAPALEATSV